jgi:uncharacterized protein YkwD
MRSVSALLSAAACCPLAAAAAAPAAAQAAPCRGADSTRSLTTVRAATVCLLNAERRARGLPAVHPRRTLRVAGRRYARAMVRGRFFSHTSPSGSDVVRRARAGGLRGRWTLGENLAWGAGRRGTARQVVAGWMRSPAHRAIVLDGRFTRIGVGVAAGTPAGVRGLTYATVFAGRP